MDIFGRALFYPLQLTYRKEPAFKGCEKNGTLKDCHLLVLFSCHENMAVKITDSGQVFTTEG